jgi:CheY-like chemotaxis protein/DNA-binding CsgD family transcriptional regulator
MTAPYRILCIEDDPRLRRLLVEDLTEAGYCVTAAGDAVAGIKAFFHECPALVLCDVRMPGISGFDLFARLRQIDPLVYGVAFIFLTALADRDSELRGRRLGADDYITKPVDYEILREIIRVRLGSRLPSTRPAPLATNLATLLAEWFQGPPRDPPAGLSAALRGQFAPPSSTQPGLGTPEPDGTLLAPMLNGLSFGLVIIDGAGMVRYANQSAAGLLGRPRGSLAGTKAISQLAAFARQHTTHARGDVSRLSARRLAIGPGGAEVTAVARLAAAPAGSPGDRVTVVLPAHPTSRPEIADLLALLFALTPAERLLAADLGGGAQLSDIARTRGVTLATARTQLKSVFSKVGVARQTDLVRTVFTLQMAIGCATP